MKQSALSWIGGLVGGCMLAVLAAPVVAKSPYVIPDCNIEKGCNAAKLVEFIIAANEDADPDVIILGAGLHLLDVPYEDNGPYGVTALPAVVNPIRIIGAGRERTTLKSGLGRHLRVVETGSLVLEKMTLSGGGFGGPGGVVYNFGVLSIAECALSGNVTEVEGGAVFNMGQATIRDSLFGGNAANVGAGIYNGASLTVVRSSFVGNRLKDGDGPGGGIHNTGTALIIGSVFEDNAGSDFNGEGGAVSNTGTMSIHGSSFVSNGQRHGGAIYNSGTLRLHGSTLTGNVAFEGGGILNDGRMTVFNSTISANEADRAAGVGNRGLLEFVNSTVVDNVGHRGRPDEWIGVPGNGIANEGGEVKLLNTIIANNIQDDLRSNCGGPLQSLGHNLSDDLTCGLGGPGDLAPHAALLAALLNNGGPTRTHASQTGSPVIGAGGLNGCPASDQRGALRPQGVCDIGAFQAGAEKLTGIARSTAGDRDGGHATDAVDRAVQSQRVAQLVNFIAADPGQDAGVALDVGGANRPVGVSHFVSLPSGARITQAIVKARVRSDDQLVFNDGIYYGDSKSSSEANPDCLKQPAGGPACSSRAPILPVIVLRDLLGREPQPGQAYEVQVNLGRAPVRTVDTTAGAGGHWSATANDIRNLLPLLAQGQWDMVFSDDLTVDWSELTVTYTMLNAPAGDLNGDGQVDRNDLNIIYAALNTRAHDNDARDLDADGFIRLNDARILVSRCTRANCATQ